MSFTLKEWPVLLIIDTPDGGRTLLACRTPASLRSNESVVVYASETGWSTSGEDQSRCPFPKGYRLRLKGSATVRGPFNDVLPGLPWVVYVEAVQP